MSDKLQFVVSAVSRSATTIGLTSDKLKFVGRGGLCRQDAAPRGIFHRLSRVDRACYLLHNGRYEGSRNPRGATEFICADC